MKKQVRLYVKGDVIDVGFRAWARIQAKVGNIEGWARNVYDDPHIFGPQGGIEIVAQAEESDLAEFIEKIKDGPPASRVEDVEILIEHPKEIFETFEITK